MDTKVLLINMPFAHVHTPSLQLGLLKSVLAHHDISSDVSYLNLKFAAYLGRDLYEKILVGRLMSFVAEWLFNRELIDCTNRTDHIDDDREAIGIFRQRALAFFNTLGINNNDDPFITTFGKDFEDVILRIRNTMIPDFFDQVLHTIDFDRYDIIGFSCTFNQTVASLSCAKLIKQRYPEKLIIMGGTSFWGDMGIGYVKSYEWLDCAVLGEGEQVLPQIIKAYRKNGSLDDLRPDQTAGVCWRSKGGVYTGTGNAAPINIDDNPVPNYDDYYRTLDDMRKHTNTVITGTAINFESSRGCIFREKRHCVFCGLNTEKAPHRIKSPQKTLDEIKELTAKHYNLTYKSTDMHLPKRYVKEFFPAVQELGSDFTFFYEMRVNHRKDELKLMADCGLTIMQIGIESLNTDLLGVMHKGKTALDNIQILKWCSELGITVIYNILWGFPGEKKRYYSAMLDVMKKIYHLQPPTLPTPLQIIRHSDYYNHYKDYGIETLTPFKEYELLFPGKKVEDLAFCYDFDRDEADLDYVVVLNETVSRWQNLFYGPVKPYLFYKTGVGFIEVFDKRHRGANTIRLEGNAKTVFEYCDSIRTGNEIVTHLQEQSTTPVTEQSVNKLLHWFCSIDLFMQEGDNYLCLAIKRNAPVEKLYNVYGTI